MRKNGQGASDDPKYGHKDKRTVYVVNILSVGFIIILI